MPHDVPRFVPPEELPELIYTVSQPPLFDVAVTKPLSGRWRLYSVCYRCANFLPERANENCPIAEMASEASRAVGVTLIVAECPLDKFESRDEPHPWIGC